MYLHKISMNTVKVSSSMITVVDIALIKPGYFKNDRAK